MNVVHLRDPVCPLPTSLLAQYLKQASGQLSCLKVGNLFWLLARLQRLLLQRLARLQRFLLDRSNWSQWSTSILSRPTRVSDSDFIWISSSLTVSMNAAFTKRRPVQDLTQYTGKVTARCTSQPRDRSPEKSICVAVDHRQLVWLEMLMLLPSALLHYYFIIVPFANLWPFRGQGSTTAASGLSITTHLPVS